MKIRTVNHIVKEGMANVFKQKFMSIATITIIIASFIVLGVFLLLVFNVNKMASDYSKQPHLSVFCKPELTDDKVGYVKEQLEKDNEIVSVIMITKQQALKEAQEKFSDNKELLNSLGEDFLPVTFNVELKNPKLSQKIVSELSKIEGVETVKSPIDSINFILKLKTGIKWISFIIFIILVIISVLIVSNAIRLAVHARKREINIMKYVGATDGFIRGPFLIEGIIIGLVGSAAAYFCISFLYDYFLNNVKQVGEFNMVSMGLIKFDQWVNMKDFNFPLHIPITFGMLVLVSFIGLGILMGIMGSVVSIRKYLKV